MRVTEAGKGLYTTTRYDAEVLAMALWAGRGAAGGRAGERDRRASSGGRAPAQRAELVEGEGGEHHGAADQGRCRRSLARTEPDPQRPEHDLEQSEQRDLVPRRPA